MADKDLWIVRHGSVVELMLDRPDALNAVSVSLARQLAAAATDLGADRSVRSVVLSSAVPRAFCVGADLKERQRFTNADMARYRPITRSAYGSVLHLPMPTIAAVHGYALGGGFELALCCDLIFADETAVFALPEVTVGLVPGGGGTQLLARRVGAGRASDLLFTGRHVTANEADQLGVVDRLVPAGAARQAGLDTARQIADNSPVAVRATKQALRTGLNVPLPDALDIEDAAWSSVAASLDRREGIAAFNERRAPQWND